MEVEFQQEKENKRMKENNRSYTKHYYAGDERIVSRIGGGGLEQLHEPIGEYGNKLEGMRERTGEGWSPDCFCYKGNEWEDLMRQLEGADMGILDEYGLFTPCSENEYRVYFKTELSRLYEYQDIHHEEPDVYWYHPGHLGSSSWIKDQSDDGIQHLQYLPFGEPWIDQRATGWNSRYTFSGKEKDEETGYSYFGARYYDSDLSIWLSVDPMAGKYPHQSNYVYCSNNPIKLVDPDGREVDVTDLAKTDQDNLTKSLSELTGLNVTTTERDGKTFLSYETKDGEPTGSEDARNQLTSIIDNKDQVINVQNSDKTDIGSYAQGNTINLDSKQIQTMMDNMQGGLNPETMGYGMSFLHESFHTKLGGNLDETPTISRMNTIRGQLGTDYGSRISHEFIDMGNIFYLGFGNGRSIEIPKEKYTWKIK